MPSAKQFLGKCALLLLPFAAPLSFPALVLFGSGEFTSQETIIHRQQYEPDEVMVGLAFSNPWRTFKLEATQQRKPAILALGSSRIMPLRGRWFRQPERFYNASGGISVLWHFEEFLRRISATDGPKLLIIALDQWDLNGNSSPIDSKDRSDPYYHKEQEPLRLLQDNWQNIYTLLAAGRIPMHRVLSNLISGHSIGLTAIQDHGGFLNDGSYPPQPSIVAAAHGLTDPLFYSYALARIETGATPGSSRYEHAQHIDPERLDTLRSLLNYCQTRRIHLIAFCPPFANQITQVMKNRGDSYGYLNEINPLLSPEFQSRGFTFKNFADMRTLSLTDADACYPDGYHSSDKTYLKILIDLAEADSKLNGQVDLKRLKTMFNESTVPCIVRELHE